MENQKEYQTRDFYNSVVLKTLGLELLRLDRGEGHFVTFIFHDPEQIAESLISEYWSRKTTVIARDLIDNINELKTRIYSK